MKKTYVCALAALFLLCAALPVAAESLKDEEAVIALTNRMMEQFTKRQFGKGMDVMLPYSVMGEGSFTELMDQLETDLEVIDSSYGLCVGSEIVTIERVGKSLVKIIQMEKHVNYAILWHLVFYNNGEGWRLVNILYNDKLLDLFEK
jgi:hypothetical protein